MRLVAAVRADLGIELSVTTVFEAPTVQALTERLTKDGAAGPEIAPVQVLVTILLIRRMPRDEATLVERARAAGEPI